MMLDQMLGLLVCCRFNKSKIGHGSCFQQHSLYMNCKLPSSVKQVVGGMLQEKKMMDQACRIQSLIYIQLYQHFPLHIGPWVLVLVILNCGENTCANLLLAQFWWSGPATTKYNISMNWCCQSSRHMYTNKLLVDSLSISGNDLCSSNMLIKRKKFPFLLAASLSCE